MEDFRGDIDGAVRSEQHVARTTNDLLRRHGHLGGYVRNPVKEAIDLLSDANLYPAIEVKSISDKSSRVHGETIVEDGVETLVCKYWDMQIIRNGIKDSIEEDLDFAVVRPGGILRALVERPNALIVYTHLDKGNLDGRGIIKARDYYFRGRELYDAVLPTFLRLAQPDKKTGNGFKVFARVPMAAIRNLAMTPKEVVADDPPPYDLWRQYAHVLEHDYKMKYFRGPKLAAVFRSQDPLELERALA